MRTLFSLVFALLLAACSLAPISTLTIQFDHPVSEADLQILKARLLDATGEKANWVALAPDRYRLSSYAFPSGEDIRYLLEHRGELKVMTSDGMALLRNADIAELQARADKQDRPTFHFALSNDGAKRLARYSQEHTGAVLRFLLDEEALSQVTLNAPLTGGAFELGLDGSVQQARRKAVILRSGVLSAPLKVLAIEQGEAATSAAN